MGRLEIPGYWKKLCTTEPYWFFYIIISLLALAVRVWFVFNIPNEPVADFATHQEVAENIANGLGHSLNGVHMAYVGPLYSLLLGAVYSLIGSSSIIIAKFLNIALSMITLVVFYAISRKFLSQKLSRLIAFALVCFLPNYIVYCNVVGTEVLFTLLLASLFLCSITKFNLKIKLPLCGVLCGLTALTKPSFLIYPFLLFLAFWITERKLLKSVVHTLVVCLCMGALILPWTISNYLAYHKFIPISYNSGITLAGNNNANNINGGWMPLSDVALLPDERKEVNALIEKAGHLKLAYEIDPILRRAGTRFIIEHPLTFLKLGLLREFNVFFAGAGEFESFAMNGISAEHYNEIPNVYTRNLRVFLRASEMIVTTTSVLGLIYFFIGLWPVILAIFLKKRKVDFRLWAPVLNIGMFICIFFVFEGQPRYNYPLLFVFIICAVSLLSRFTFLQKHDIIEPKKAGEQFE